MIPEVTLLELEKAPAAVRAHLERIPESLVEVLALDSEAEALATEYIHDGARMSFEAESSSRSAWNARAAVLR